ncbi:ABC transporter ATP-binding protein [Dactylosporangium sp. NPDC051485]|uniref:ABC transporter ATP-binding protein n=1 Tax=Dactylosporangium sp. NPDC051485 TaxID=3154846 RepID=UPI00343C0A33
MLEAIGLSAGYGPNPVLDGLDLRVEEGEIVVVLGANGAGKTTTLRALSGMIGGKGKVMLAGNDISRSRPDVRAKLGLGHIPEGRGTFPFLSVEDNLRLGGHVVKDRHAFDVWFELFPILAERRKQAAGSLSGGEQQMLAVARALMARPKMLLLDEPSMGLAPMVTAALFGQIEHINKQFGTSMLIVEQNANLSLKIASRGYVLESGSVVLSGRADELLDNDGIRRAYLGS